MANKYGDQLIKSLGQKDRAEIYRNFLEKYLNEATAKTALDGDAEAIEHYIIARMLDDGRRAAERAG